MSCKKDVLQNFANVTGKHLCQSLSFNKVAGLRPKKDTLAQAFSYEFCKIFKTPFFTEHLRATASVQINPVGQIKCLENIECGI